MRYAEMTIEELIAELEKVESYSFYLQMKDRWTATDYDTNKKYNETIKKIKKEIAARA